MRVGARGEVTRSCALLPPLFLLFTDLSFVSSQILDDADLPRAARAVASSTLLNSGQICMSTERVIIQRGAAEAFVEQLTGIFKQVKAGDFQNDSSAMIGALFSEASAENVVSLLKEAVDAGAKVAVGDMQRQGTIVQPHVVLDVKPGMRLWDRESFGPGACLWGILATFGC